MANVELKVTISEEDYKVLEWQVYDSDPQLWLQKAIDGKIAASEERMLLELTDKRIEKLSKQEKKDLIKNSTLKTRKERDAEELAAHNAS